MTHEASPATPVRMGVHTVTLHKGWRNLLDAEGHCIGSVAEEKCEAVLGAVNSHNALLRLAACLASAIKCGERWTETLQKEYDDALALAEKGDV